MRPSTGMPHSGNRSLQALLKKGAIGSTSEGAWLARSLTEMGFQMWKTKASTGSEDRLLDQYPRGGNLGVPFQLWRIRRRPSAVRSGGPPSLSGIYLPINMYTHLVQKGAIGCGIPLASISTRY